MCRKGEGLHVATLSSPLTRLYRNCLSWLGLPRIYRHARCSWFLRTTSQSEKSIWNKIGANRVEHTLMMSRSVWQLQESFVSLEGLQWPEVLQGLARSQTSTGRNVLVTTKQQPSRLK